VAEQQAQQAQRISDQQQREQQQKSGSTIPMIDPRITSSPRQQQNGYAPTSTPQQPTSAPTKSDSPNGISNGSSNSTPQPLSQNIPSIASLVNNISADDARSAGGASNGTGSRGGSASPKAYGEPNGNGPQDIHLAGKFGFVGEDKNALRRLDKKFCI
jgi:hypothetical protein